MVKPGRGFGPGIKEMQREELFNVISSGGGGWTFEDERSLTEARRERTLRFQWFHDGGMVEGGSRSPLKCEQD